MVQLTWLFLSRCPSSQTIRSNLMVSNKSVDLVKILSHQFACLSKIILFAKRLVLTAKYFMHSFRKDCFKSDWCLYSPLHINYVILPMNVALVSFELLSCRVFGKRVDSWHLPDEHLVAHDQDRLSRVLGIIANFCALK